MNTKSRFILAYKNSSQFFAGTRILKIIGFPVRLSYKLIVQWILCVDLPDQVKMGQGCQIFHGMALVVHKNVEIGDSVILRHSTTLGERVFGGGTPRIGSNVDIGAHVTILGNIDIGDNVRIGAGSLLLNDVPANSTVTTVSIAKVTVK